MSQTRGVERSQACPSFPGDIINTAAYMPDEERGHTCCAPSFQVIFLRKLHCNEGHGGGPRARGESFSAPRWAVREERLGADVGLPQKGRMLRGEFISAALQVLPRSLADPRAQRVPESSVRRDLSTSPDRPTITAAGKSTHMNPGEALQIISSGVQASDVDEPIHQCGKRAN